MILEVKLIFKRDKKNGFALIEIIRVLAVMTILTAIAILSVTAMRDNSKYNADVRSFENIKRTVSLLVIDDALQKYVVIVFNQGGGTFSASTRPVKGVDEFIAAIKTENLCSLKTY